MLLMLKHTLGRIHECLWAKICSFDIFNSPYGKRPLSWYRRPPSLLSVMKKSAFSEGFRNIGGRGRRGGRQKTQPRQAEKIYPVWQQHSEWMTAKSATYLLSKILRLHNTRCSLKPISLVGRDIRSPYPLPSAPSTSTMPSGRNLRASPHALLSIRK